MIWAAVLFFLSSRSTLPGAAWHPLVPVAAHVLVFAVLAAALEWGRTRSGWRVAPAVTLGLAAAYGALDEWHQSFVPERTATLADWGADLVGIVLGYVVFRAVRGRLDRRRGLEISN